MARPIVQGLKYFPLDVAFFDDYKTLMIEERHGMEGGYCALRLIAMVYEQGYYMPWEAHHEVAAARRMGNRFTGEKVMEVLNTCLDVGLFNRELFDRHHVLTSHGIQVRWQEVQTLMRHKVDINAAYWLVEPPAENVVIATITPENVQEPPIIATITPPPTTLTPSPTTITPQKERKGKEKKERTIKQPVIPVGSDGAKAPAQKSFKQWTQAEFIAEINNYKEQYSYQLRNDFYKYWKERSPGGKMRFQLQRTWETKLRLDTWLRRENAKNKNNETHKQPTTRTNKQTGAEELLEDLRGGKYGGGGADAGRAANY